MMSMDEKLSMLESVLGLSFTDAQTAMFVNYLKMAEKEILSWRYSYAKDTPTSVPSEYEVTQVFAVVAGFSQQGAEGQTNHSENGISGTFKYIDMVAYIHANVIPYVKVVM